MDQVVCFQLEDRALSQEDGKHTGVDYDRESRGGGLVPKDWSILIAMMLLLCEFDRAKVGVIVECLANRLFFAGLFA